MNKFTVEEINFMCVFETQNRMKMMEEIRRIMPYIKDSDMEDLSRQVLRKLDGMTDKEFAENNLQPRLLYPARISFKYEGEIKSFTDKQKLREFSTTKPAFNIPMLKL